MAVKNFDIARKFDTDQLLAKFKEVQQSAKTTDAMLQMVGQNSNLDTFIAALSKIEDLLSKIQKSDSSELSDLGSALKQIFNVNINEPTQQLGDFLDKLQNIFSELQHVDISKNTKDMKAKLNSIVTAYQDALNSVGIKSDLKLDTSLDISDLFKQVSDEFQKLNELKVDFGDLQQIAVSGQQTEQAVEDAGKKIKKKVQQQTKEQTDILNKAKKDLVKAYKEYYNTIIDEEFDVDSQEPSDKMNKIQDKIDGILGTLKMDNQTKGEFTDIIGDIQYGDLDVEDIATTVTKLFKKVQVEAAQTAQVVEEALNVESAMNPEQIGSQAVEQMQNIEKAVHESKENIKKDIDGLDQFIDDIFNEETSDSKNVIPTDIVDSSELTEAKKQIQDLQQYLDDLNNSYKKLQTENEILVEIQQDTYQQLYDTQQEANKLNDALSTERNNLAEELADTKKHAQELQQSLDNLNEEYLKSKGANDALKSINSNLERQLFESEDGVEKYGSRVEELSSDLSEAIQKFEQINNELAETKQKLAQLENVKPEDNTKQYGEQINKLTSDLNEAAQKIQQTNNELAEAKQKLAQFESAGQTSVAVESEIGDFERLKGKIDEVKQSIDSKTQAFKEEKDSVGTYVTDEASSLQTLIDRLTNVKQAITEKTGVFKDSKDSVEKYTTEEIASLQGLIDKLTIVKQAISEKSTVLNNDQLGADSWVKHEDALLKAAEAEELKISYSKDLTDALEKERKAIDKLNTLFTDKHVDAVTAAALAEYDKLDASNKLTDQLKQELDTVKKLVQAWQQYNKNAPKNNSNPNNNPPPPPPTPNPATGRRIVFPTDIDLPTLQGEDGRDLLGAIELFKQQLKSGFNDADVINITDMIFGDNNELQSTTVRLQHFNKELGDTVTQLYKVHQDEQGDFVADLISSSARIGENKKHKFTIAEELKMARDNLDAFKTKTQDLQGLKLTNLENAFNTFSQTQTYDNLERFVVQLKIAQREAAKLRAQNKTPKGQGKLATTNANELIQRVQQYVKGVNSNLTIDTSSFATTIQKLTEARDELDKAIKQGPGNLSSEEYNNVLKTLTQKVQKASQEVEKHLTNAFKIDGIQEEIGKIDVKNINDLESALKQSVVAFVESEDAYRGNTIEAQKFDQANGTLKFSIRDQSGALHEYVIAANTAGKAVKVLSHNIKETEDDLSKIEPQWKSFTKSLLKSSGQLIDAFVGGIGIHELGQQIRNGIQDVRELDLALTELKKVTDETDATYENFLEKASKTSSEIGTTITNFTNATADFARLGYSIDEAATLAESATVLLNVSEFDNIDQASSALISTMQAFKDDTKTTEELSMEIINLLNHIGNRYPVATNELADGLATSSAALVAANNSIQEQVALLSAGNATMQDIHQVASGLKIVAARLRGTKSDIDDDPETVVTNVSKLQSKIKALTAEANGGEGINIINEQGNYKSTYDILEEISRVFNKMDDISQASLLELIAGKNRSSVIAAVLQNGEILRQVMDDAAESTGSAAAENAKYLDSIQGKIDQFTNSLQTMWSHFLDSDTVKSFVDLGTDIIQTMDDMGAGWTLVSGSILLGIGKIMGSGFSEWFTKLGTKKAIPLLEAVGKKFGGMAKGAQSAGVALGLLKTNTAGAVSGLTALGTSLGIATIALTAIIVGINAYNKKQEEMRQAAVESANALSEELDSFEKYKTQIADLQAKLEDNNLSEQEAYDVRKDLLSIQDDLIKKYGKEAEGLNLITQSATEANAALDKVAQKQAEIWLGEYAGPIDDAVAFFTSDTQGAKLGEGLNKETKITGDMTTATVGLLLDEYDKAHKGVKQNTISMQQRELTFSGSVEEVKQEVEALMIYLREQETQFTSQLSSATGKQATALKNDIESIQTYQQRLGNAYSTWFGEDSKYLDYKTTFEQYQEVLGFTKYSEAVDKIEQAKKDYQTALDAGDLEKAKTLAQDVISLTQEAITTATNNGEAWMDSFFLPMQEGYNAAIQKINFDKAWNSEENEIKEAIAQAVEKASSAAGHKIEDQELLNLGDHVKSVEIKSGIVDLTEAQEAVALYNDTLREARELGVDENKTIFGNIDTNNRQVLEWTQENLNKYAEAIESWGATADELANSYSTIFASSGNYAGYEIAFSPMLQTENGAVLLDANTVDEYIFSLIDKATNGGKDKLYTKELLTLDAKGIKKDGVLIKGLLADIGDTAVATSQQMHFVGTDGALNDVRQYLQEVADKYQTNVTTLLTDMSSLSVPYVANIEWDESTNASQAQIELYGQLCIAAYKYHMGVDELITLLTEQNIVQGEVFNTVEQETISLERKAHTLSQLTSTVEKYNEAEATSAEFMVNGVTVTEDYKEILTSLIDDKEGLAECFDDNNALMITNVDLLNDLLKSSKQNIAADVKLAKSQAGLKYNNLVKQLNKTLSSTNKLDDATRDAARSTLEQLNAVEQAIYNYGRLEESLLGAHNAYTKFAEAKEIDALNTYGDSYVEMAQTMYDAFYVTGKVGTEANWAAIEALIPDSVYKHLTEEADKVTAIYNYYKKNVLPTLTNDDGELSIEFKNIEDFVKKGLSKEVGIFKGDTENFDLVEGMNLKEAAKRLKMTETQVYSLFAALDQYNTDGDGLSFLEELDDSFDGEINKINHELKTLNEQKLALLDNGGYEKNQEAIDDLNRQIEEQNALLKVQQTEAYKSIQVYTQNGQAITALETIEDKTKQLTPEFAMAIGIAYAGNEDKTIQQVLDELYLQKQKLEEPTVMMATFAIEGIDSRIEEIQTLLNNQHQLNITANTEGIPVRELTEKLNAEMQDLLNEKEELALTFGIQLDEDEEEALMSKLDEFEEYTIHDKSFKVNLTNYYTTRARLKELLDLVDAFNGGTSTTYEPAPRPNPDNPYLTTNEAYANGTLGAPRTEDALVGEINKEIIVRGNRWFTVGNNGPEFFPVKKNDIIFNAEQTEDLLSKGHTKTRGKAFASGTAYAGLWKPTKGSDDSDKEEEEEDTAEQLIDFIEIKLEEIENIIAQTTAKLEHIIDDSSRIIDKRAEYDKLITETQTKMKTNSDATKYYAQKAAELLQEVPESYREMAKNGAIAVQDFIGEDQVEIAEAIEKFREYDIKADNAQLAALEAVAEISALSLQRIEDIADDFDNIIGLMDAKASLIQVNMDLADVLGYRMSEQYYEELIKGTDNTILRLEEKKKALTEDLKDAMEKGELKMGSDEWYQAVNLILACDEAIVDCKIDTEEWNKAIRDLKWDNLELFINELDSVESQLSNLYDLVSDDDKIVDEMGNWTAEGITALGLLAQQMELAQYTAQQYGDAIKDLEASRSQYSDDEYNEKLAELIDKQWESIEAYEQAKDAIIDLNKTRVDAIKNGIEKEIDAYKELIEAKKESLQADKDAHDFEKSVAEKQKSIATIQRQLAAIAHNDSAEATAERKKLQAELLEANAELEELYYDNSIDTQIDALDKEYDAYEAHKNKEMDLLEEWLKQQEQVISESYQVVQGNTEVVFSTLNGIANEYGVQISSAITTPWQDGQNALSDYTGAFNAAIGSLSANASSFINQLNAIKQAQDNIVNSANNMASNVIQDVNNTYNEVAKDYTYVDEFGKTIADYSREYFAAKDRQDADAMQAANDAANRIRDKLGVPHQIANEDIGLVRISNYKKAYAEARARGDADGMQAANDAANAIRATLGLAPENASDDIAMIRKKYQGYAKGTTGTKKDELAWIDEQGLEELVLHAGPDGRLQYLTKGTSVIPNAISENLIKLGSMNPQDVLDRSRPTVSVPNLINNNITIDMDIAEVVHIDSADRDSIPDIAHAVQTQMDRYMKNINNSFKRYTR